MWDNESASSGFSLVLPLLIASITFWVQAIVTEERFVPALNVLAHQARISPEVAAATIMAAGAACPNLLAVAISIFITHSGLGMGTIIGSEMFQQLFCVAGAVLAHRNGNLVLSPATVLREVAFYALSLALLLRALVSDVRPAEDDEQNENYIYISFWDSLSLLLVYAFYVVVCAKFEWIIKRFRSCSNTPHGTLKASVTNDEDSSCSIAALTPSAPFLRQVKHEPSQNFHSANEDSVQDNVVMGAFSDPCVPYDEAFCAPDFDMIDHTEDEHDDIYVSTAKPRGFEKFCRFCRMTPANEKHWPSEMHDLEEIKASGDGKLSCFLWQESIFYDRTLLVAKNAWQLRWFTFSNGGVVSVPDRVGFEHHKLVYPRFGRVETDASHLVLRLHSLVADGPDYVMMAPCTKTFNAVTEWVQADIERNRQEAAEKKLTVEESATTLERDMIAAEKDANPSLIDYPYGSPLPLILLHFALFPVKALLYFTIPDVHEAKHAHGKGLLFRAMFAVVASIGWLAVASYAMVTSLEHVGSLLNVPNSVVGITVSAVGTSIPIYVTSIVAARRGLGNMAVSNALGSNTFNILIGLGLPFMLDALLCSDDGYYRDLHDEEITESIVLLAGALVVFLLMVLWNHFILSKWHAWTMGAMYIAYLVYAVAMVYAKGWKNKFDEA